MEEFLSSEDIQDILKLIDEGFLFERFGQEFLTARLGYNFLASGGIKDRGIDGLEYASDLDNDNKDVFQLSIDKNPDSKISDTVDTLNNNGIEYSRLTYVTNQHVKNKDLLIDDYLNNKSVPLRIFDGKWIADNSNHSPATQNVIGSLIRNHLRKFQKPGEGLIVHDYLSDPKLYVFLMQQIGRSKEIDNINDSLIDALILFSLRDTDPDKDEFLSSDEITNSVRGFFNFEIERIQSKVNKRLKKLSKKPSRKINHHADIDKYCMPYEARLDILANNAKDMVLYDNFHEEASGIIENNLSTKGVNIRSIASLLNKTLEKIYYNQGLEFSDFLLNGGSDDAFEGHLADTVDEIIEETSIDEKFRSRVKDAIIISIRELIYHGSSKAKEYLRSLSKTYLMLFLLKCDPNIVNYFQAMAANMNIYVCTSILVPALSEIFLESQNQRYWGLLKSAKSRGARLIVNDSIINELTFHIQRSLHIYETEYENNIDFYSTEAEELVDQILVRAYIHALKEGKASSYRSFLENFITIDGPNQKQELIDFLFEEFGIEYVSKSELGVKIDEEEYQSLV